MRSPWRARRAGLVAIVLLSGSGLAAPAQAEELPLPGPSIEGPVYKPATRRRPRARTEKPLWELGLGVAGVRFPDYRGSDQSPLLRAAAALHRLPRRAAARRPRRRAGDPVRRRSGSTVDISVVGLGADAQPATTTRARACPTCAGTFEIGPNLNVELWQSADQRLKVEFRLPLRAGDHARDAIRTALGLTLSPNINLDAARLHRRLEPRRADRAAVRRPAPAPVLLRRGRRSSRRRSGRPTRPPAATPAGGAIAALSRRFGNLWIGGFVRYDDLRGAVFAPSPLVRRDHALHRRLRHVMDLRGIEPARRGGRLTQRRPAPAPGLRSGCCSRC